MAVFRKPGPLGLSLPDGAIPAGGNPPSSAGGGGRRTGVEQPPPWIPAREGVKRPAFPLPLLKLGSRGEDVEDLQELLNSRLEPGPELEEDGIFGPKTRHAVVQYQAGVKIKADGIVGRDTWFHLFTGKTARFRPLLEPGKPPGPASAAAAALASKKTKETEKAGAKDEPGESEETPSAAEAAKPAAEKSAGPKPPAAKLKKPEPPKTESIWDWPLKKKLEVVLDRVPGRLGPEAKAEFLALCQWENLILALAIIAGFCLLSGGTAVVLGFVLLGVDISLSLATALQITAFAASDRELDEAADQFAHIIITVGVAVFFHAIGKMAKGLKSEGRAVGEGPPKGSGPETPAAGEGSSPKPAKSEAPPAPKPPPKSGAFADDAKLQDHFDRHGGDFGAKTPQEYQQQANDFLNGSRGDGVLEKTRPNGDVVRYNPATDEFGVAKSDGTIKTYYKPDPSVHGKPSNLDYFNGQ